MASTKARSIAREESGIDIASAKAEFNELSRQLSAHSLQSQDREKDGEHTFDLREYLTSSNDARVQAGIKHKHVGVVWEDLKVDVIGGMDNKIYIGTFGGAIMEFFLAPLLFLWGLAFRLLPKRAEPPTRTILHPSSGFVKPGEMCLVLGSPGSGCSTFLKLMANHREGYASVTGNVKYAGIDAQTMAKIYRGEVVYNQEDDVHISTLTAGQTLKFALSTKSPGSGGLLPGVSRDDFEKQVLDTILKMLNISHTKDTLVGDEFVRGISGGERKRVSVAEMMCARGVVHSWDSSTKGLDASTALDFIKSLRIMTDILGQTTFVSLYQASDAIYNLFDKVIVLDEGHQVYFGPPAEARGYFENLGYNPLPRQSTADYLTGCADPNERQFAVGAINVPSSPVELEAAYRRSNIARNAEDARSKYKQLMETEKSDQANFRDAVKAEKRRRVSETSPFTTGLASQVKALTIRQFQLRLQDRFQLWTSFGMSTLLALVIGAAFINLPLTSAGAFTRSGVIFAALLTTCLDAFNEMPMQMLGRPILSRQTNYGFYRPAATVLARTFADLPFSATRVLVFNVFVYSISHLNRNAGAFFTFHFLNYFTYLALQGFFRTLGVFCFNFESAFRISVFFIPNMVMYGGYMIPYFDIKKWLFWIYYINPLSFAWTAIVENEFRRISLTCTGNNIVPRNGPGQTTYPDELGPNQSCTLFGASPASSSIPGKDYISVGYGLDVEDIWRRNFLVIVGFIIFFQITQILSTEYFPSHPASSLSFSIFAKDSEESKNLNLILRQRQGDKERRQGEKSDSDKMLEPKNGPPDLTHRQVFTWENLNYEVPVPGGTRKLLKDVSGYVKPGSLTALMGASGAGKTTCLDVLAQRKNIGVISGNILVDGRPLDTTFARGTAYAEQMDVHEGTATVREAMRFSAYLRQPAEISEGEKNQYVEEMIELLELQPLSEALVFSLSVEARKRLTIGVELAAKPELLLFLDEPTSGLDGSSAWNLVRFLRKLADQGQAILCTIHQPSSLLFESFDRIILLQKGGETVYCGGIGKDSEIIRDYFARHRAICPPNANPAEFMLEAIGAGITARIGDRDWGTIWNSSEECQRLKDEIETIKIGALARLDPAEKKSTSTYATSLAYQLKVVLKRNNTALWRSPDYVYSRIFVHVFISLFISLSFLQLGNSLRDLQYRIFGIFWISILPAIVMIQLEPMFLWNRRVFIRESSSRIYSPIAFAVGQLLGEVPYSVLCGFIYWIFMVFPMGYGKGATGTNGLGFQLLVIIFVETFGVSLGQMVASLSPSVQIAVLFNPFLSLTLTTFCGVTIPYPSMAKFWKVWLYVIDPFTYGTAAMLSTELHGLVINCRSDEFAVFSPPSGQTCKQWAAAFITSFGGYIDNPDDTASCRYCEFAVGDEYFVPLNVVFSDRWRNAFILLIFFCFNVFVTIVASRYLRYAKR